MTSIYMDFQEWLRTEKEWPTANSGRLGEYCIALNKAEKEILIATKNETSNSIDFEIVSAQTFDSSSEAMNIYRQLCSLDITITQFLENDF